MPNVVISPDMSLPVPVVGVDPGPDWATDINACLGAIDSHNHTPGQGVQITPAAININTALSFNGQNLTAANSLGMNSLVAALTSLLDSLQTVGGELHYIDGSGNDVVITAGGAVAGSTGTITGLPSGTASASFAGATFTFQSATNTPATMAIGPIVTGAAAASPKTVTLSASVSQPANYAMIWPLAQGAANSLLVNDGSGNLSFQAIGASQVGTGSGVTVNTTAAISSISLTAGTWIIFAGITFDSGLSTNLQICVSTTAASFSGVTAGLNYFFTTTVTTSSNTSVTVPGYIVSPGSTTTYYLNANTSSSTTCSGSISAVRIR